MNAARGLPRVHSGGFISLGLVLLLLIGLAAFGGVGWYVSNHKVKTTSETASTTQESSNSTSREQCLLSAKDAYLSALDRSGIKCATDALGWPDDKCVQETGQGKTIMQALFDADNACYSPVRTAPSPASTSNAFLTASPTSGVAGRTVITFSMPSGEIGGLDGYFIDWGDNALAWYACGHSFPLLDVYGGVNENCLPVTVQHTYVGAGTPPAGVDPATEEPKPVIYTATLNKIIHVSTSGYYDSIVVGTTTVTITGWNTLPSPTCVLTASPNPAKVGQKITISWASQHASSEGPVGYGAWVGLGGDDSILIQMKDSTSLSGSQTVTAGKASRGTLGFEINGPGGNGAGKCTVEVTVI